MAGPEQNQYQNIQAAWSSTSRTTSGAPQNELLTVAQSWGLISETATDDANKINVISAFFRVYAAKLFTKPSYDKRGRPRPNWADQKQNGLLKRLDKWTYNQYERGILDEKPVPTFIPTTANITAHVQDILQQFSDYTLAGAITPKKLDAAIDQKTRQYVDLLWKGERDQDNNGQPTSEEIQIAKDITMQVGFVRAATIKKTLYDIVYGRAADIVATQQTGGLAEEQQRFYKGLTKLKQQPPTKWFCADWITTEIMLTKEEQKKLENVTWTITPTLLIVRSISPQSTKDEITIPLSEIGRSYIAWDGTPKYIDAVKMFGTRLLQQYLTPYLQQSEIGGLTTIGSGNRSQDVVTFAVRNGKVVADMLMLLGATNREYLEGAELKTKALRDPDPKYLPPIRPTIIQQLLPDPLLLEKDVLRDIRGNISWESLEQQLKEDLQEAERLLKITAARILATNEFSQTIDENGNPSLTADRRALKWRQQQIDGINQRITKVKQLEKQSSRTNKNQNNIRKEKL